MTMKCESNRVDATFHVKRSSHFPGGTFRVWMQIGFKNASQMAPESHAEHIPVAGADGNIGVVGYGHRGSEEALVAQSDGDFPYSRGNTQEFPKFCPKVSTTRACACGARLSGTAGGKGSGRFGRAGGPCLRAGLELVDDLARGQIPPVAKVLQRRLVHPDFTLSPLPSSACARADGKGLSLRAHPSRRTP